MNKHHKIIIKIRKSLSGFLTRLASAINPAEYTEYKQPQEPEPNYQAIYEAAKNDPNSLYYTGPEAPDNTQKIRTYRIYKL